MERKLLSFLCLFWLMSGIYSQTGNVGINTSDPQQKLHIAGETSSMRVDNLNSTNNTNNNGPLNAPLYVDHNGVLTLEFDLFYNAGGNDEFDGNLPNTSIHQINSEYVAQELFTREVTVVRPSYIEIKFSVSFEVYLNDRENTITDNMARIIDNYILLNNNPVRRYGMTSKCYVNGRVSGVTQMYFNNASTYIFLPVGTHTLHFYGGVGSGSLMDTTFVKFGTAQDMLLMRIY